MSFDKFKSRVRELNIDQLNKLLKDKELDLMKHNNKRMPLWNPQKDRFESQYPFNRTRKHIAIIKTELRIR